MSHHQIFIVCYLQFVAIKNLYVALRSTAYGASRLARNPQRQLFVGDTAKQLKNGTVERPGNSQIHGGVQTKDGNTLT